MSSIFKGPLRESLKVSPLKGEFGGEDKFFQIKVNSGETLLSSSSFSSNLFKMWTSGRSPGNPGTDCSNPAQERNGL